MLVMIYQFIYVLLLQAQPVYEVVIFMLLADYVYLEFIIINRLREHVTLLVWNWSVGLWTEPELVEMRVASMRPQQLGTNVSICSLPVSLPTYYAGSLQSVRYRSLPAYPQDESILAAKKPMKAVRFLKFAGAGVLAGSSWALRYLWFSAMNFYLEWKQLFYCSNWSLKRKEDSWQTDRRTMHDDRMRKHKTEWLHLNLSPVILCPCSSTSVIISNHATAINFCSSMQVLGTMLVE